MKTFRLLSLVGVGLLVLVVRFLAPSSGGGASSHADTGAFAEQQRTNNSGVPQKVLSVLSVVRQTGHAPDGYVGGRVFQNREGRLPATGDYREFDVDPHEGGRNAERIVMDWTTKQAWYTADHYQTFTPLP